MTLNPESAPLTGIMVTVFDWAGVPVPFVLVRVYLGWGPEEAKHAEVALPAGVATYSVADVPTGVEVNALARGSAECAQFTHFVPYADADVGFVSAMD